MINIETSSYYYRDFISGVPQETIDNVIKFIYEHQGSNDYIEIVVLFGNNAALVAESAKEIGAKFEDLGMGYGIIGIKGSDFRKLSQLKGVQYAEFPKIFTTTDIQSNTASCIPRVWEQYNLSGKGVLIGFIDTGIDYTHPSFLDSTGKTRIEYIYDIYTATSYNKAQIEQALASPNPQSIVPEEDLIGHGTAVASVAAGGGNLGRNNYGVAYEASIAMVKVTGKGTFTSILSTQIMRGLKFLIDKSNESNMPLVVNISLSSNDGAHNGSSLIEKYIQEFSQIQRVAIVIAAGNEGEAGHHYSSNLELSNEIFFNIAGGETNMVLQLYKPPLSEITIEVVAPSGQTTGRVSINEGAKRLNLGAQRCVIYNSGPKPFDAAGEISINIIPNGNTIDPGEWQVNIKRINQYDGIFDIWLPIAEALSPDTKFLQPDPFNTLGIPATVDGVISVGSYDSTANNYSAFSGRGIHRVGSIRKPDLLAPGQNIMAANVGGGFAPETGTSVAAPQVAGMCALILQWGIVKNNDAFVFGERLKYYLIKGAKRTRMDVVYPTRESGYGFMCGANSMSLLSNDTSTGGLLLTSGQDEEEEELVFAPSRDNNELINMKDKRATPIPGNITNQDLSNVNMSVNSDPILNPSGNPDVNQSLNISPNQGSINSPAGVVTNGNAVNQVTGVTQNINQIIQSTGVTGLTMVTGATGVTNQNINTNQVTGVTQGLNQITQITGITTPTMMTGAIGATSVTGTTVITGATGITSVTGTTGETIFSATKGYVDLNIDSQTIYGKTTKLHYLTPGFVDFLVQYKGDLISAVEKINDKASAFALDRNYAIVSVRVEEYRDILLSIDEIVYIDSSGIYTLEAVSPAEASQANTFHYNPYLTLTGYGTLIGIIDTGIDYLNKDFIKADNTTNIIRIWDQGISTGPTPSTIFFGTEYKDQDINRALNASLNGGDPYSIVPSRDINGHGTAMAGLIAGRGNNSEQGIAFDASIAMVKLQTANEQYRNYFGTNGKTEYQYRNTDILLGIKYLSDLAKQLVKPMVIFIPLGSTIGAHDGSSVIERYIDDISQDSGLIVVTSTGNQGLAENHTAGKIEKQGETKSIELYVDTNQTDLLMNIYITRPDRMGLSIVSPAGEAVGNITPKKREGTVVNFVLEGTSMNVMFIEPDEHTGDEIIVVRATNLRPGIWNFGLIGEYIVNGTYNAWLVQRELLEPKTRFLSPTQYTTLTLPATSSYIIPVAYYNQNINATVSQSGRGFTRDGRIAPIIAAGGVDAIVTAPNNRKTMMTGGSIAGAVISGCCCQLLQWGIVNKNDVTMYARKVQTYLMRGTDQRIGDVYPNEQWGFGVINMQKLFDNIKGSVLSNDKSIGTSPVGFREDENIYVDTEEAEIIAVNNKNEFNIGNLYIRNPII